MSSILQSQKKKTVDVIHSCYILIVLISSHPTLSFLGRESFFVQHPYTLPAPHAVVTEQLLGYQIDYWGITALVFK